MEALRPFVGTGAVVALVVGGGTGSRTVVETLARAFPSVEMVVVDETGTTLEARGRYLEEHPPRGWERLLPRGLRVPKVPIDDYVAQILVERHLASLPHRPTPDIEDTGRTMA